MAQNGGAALADDDGLGVGEDGGDCEAAGALDIHEERPGGGHKILELVLLSLGSRGRVEKINGENLCKKKKIVSTPSSSDGGLMVSIIMIIILPSSSNRVLVQHKHRGRNGVISVGEVLVVYIYPAEYLERCWRGPVGIGFKIVMIGYC